MIGYVRIYAPEKLVTYHSDNDYERGITIGGKCELTLDSKHSEWITGTVIDVCIDSFVMQKCDGAEIIISCKDIYDIRSAMDDSFRLEVDTGSGGYGFDDDFNELLEDVEREFGKETRDEVKEWAFNSKENDQFNKYGMIITNAGKG